MVNRFKNFKKRLGKWFWVILIILLLGGFFYFKSARKPEPQKTEVKKGEVKEELILTGAVNAEKYASLYFPTGGKVAWVSATEGQKIKKGQPITSLNKTILNATYQDALNDYRNYQAVAENVLDSVKGHDKDETFTQKAARTTAEVNRDNAYEAVNAARYNLANATIYAPFDGVVSSLPFTSPGVNVNVTDLQAVIVDPVTIYFDVDSDQNDVTNITPGQSVDIVLDSYPDKPLKGKVSFISITPKSGVTGTNYKVKVVFENMDLGQSIVRIGMTGDARFILKKKDQVLYIPNEFISTDKDGHFVLKGEKKEKTRVEIGIEGETVTEIVSGVAEGDVLYE
jgi:RND family efflux transporter MFP subunit